MPAKSDRWIVEMALKHEMIKPFSESQVRLGISYGVSSYGYDISLADEFKILKSAGLTELDPKNPPVDQFIDTKAESILVPANSFILGRTREYFKIPRDVITVCMGKSTYARCGIVINVTPFEPEWEGFATISISNTAPVPVRVYANEGIAQLIFLEAAELCTESYADKKGKYQAQQGITTSKSD
ncbi:MAG: dCTP deaminase [Candidatus Zixiibacteriota bacterium]|nr:MAG: dCTP deaminase [candidate division Zixibacteria bacterium]